MNPLVSILIPAYNAEEYIGETLESAVGQTYRDKEIVVVDDGSTDDTVAIAKRYQTRGVRVIEQANQGAAAARNAAFAACAGDYIQWLDADDLLAPDKVERQVEAARLAGSGRTLLSAAWGRFLYRPHRAEFTPSVLWCDLSPAEWLVRKIESNAYMQTATWLVSREVALAAGPWDTRLLGDDDGEYFCRVLLASDRVLFVSDARVLYRRAGVGSLSATVGSRRKLEALLLSLRLHFRYLQTLDDSPRARHACVTRLQGFLGLSYPEWPDLSAEAEALARSLGGRLTTPVFSWKYAWLKWLVGSAMAKRVQTTVQPMKWSVLRYVDKALSAVDAPKKAADWRQVSR